MIMYRNYISLWKICHKFSMSWSLTDSYKFYISIKLAQETVQRGNT